VETVRDNRHLAADHVLADVDCDVTALADKAAHTPDLGGAHGTNARRGGARCFQSTIDTDATGEFAQRLDRIILGGIDRGVGAEFPRALQARRIDIKARSHERSLRVQAASPTGRPAPARKSQWWRADRLRRISALEAVPVPQEMAAPASNESLSGSETRVFAGTFRYGACPPSSLLP
jgi:hypothetical protein